MLERGALTSMQNIEKVAESKLGMQFPDQVGQVLETGGGRVAYILRDNDTAERRQITIGGRSLSAVEIVAGLDAGDRVIISSIDQFRGAETVLITD